MVRDILPKVKKMARLSLGPKDWMFCLKKPKTKLALLFLGFLKAAQDMFLEFPFEYANIPGLGKLFYPVVNLELKTVSSWQEFQFLVDTGADITTVPLHLLPILGVNKNELSKTKIFGVGGFSVQTWNVKIPMRINKTEFLTHISGVETKGNSMPLLLGRKDIFEQRFNLVLDSKKKITVISENIF